MKKKIALILKKSRRNKGYTTEYVANELKNNGLDISSNTLYNYENMHSQPNADMFVALCRIYGITSLDIFFDDMACDTVDEEIEDYSALNDNGKKKVKDYISDLLANKHYKKNKTDYTKEFKRYTDAVLQRDTFEIAAYGADGTEGSYTPPTEEIT